MNEMKYKMIFKVCVYFLELADYDSELVFMEFSYRMNALKVLI